MVEEIYHPVIISYRKIGNRTKKIVMNLLLGKFDIGSCALAYRIVNTLVGD